MNFVQIPTVWPYFDLSFDLLISSPLTAARNRKYGFARFCYFSGFHSSASSRIKPTNIGLMDARPPRYLAFALTSFRALPLSTRLSNYGRSQQGSAQWRRPNSSMSIQTNIKVDSNASAPDVRNTTIISWNVNSLRALLRKNPNALQNLVNQYKPDILCLQETKLQKEHEHLFKKLLENDLPFSYFNSSEARLGYSGTAIYTRAKPRFIQAEIRHEAGDEEGRVLALEYSALTVVNVYTMNSGTGLRRLPIRQTWDAAFRRFIREQYMENGKPVVVVGDLNVALTEKDVHDPIKVRGLPGFSDIERDAFSDLLDTGGLVDAYRLLNPDVTKKFTFWDYRSFARKENRGWRIDYTLVSDTIVNAVRHAEILTDVQGSDHCPVLVTLGPGFIDYSLSEQFLRNEQINFNKS